ncbi:MAG: hypothetical protein C3F15_14860 [Holophagae bacterium]|nr:MAG: hypothetical protein C3F15_14860 [Holophagae bacterium]
MEPRPPDGDRPVTESPTPFRTSRHAWLAVLVALPIVAAHLWLVTRGTGSFVGRETWGTAFDSLGRSLLSGRADVEPGTISWEGFEEAGKVYLSFGPFPALLRIPANAVLPSMAGQWSRASCLTGTLLALLAASLTFASCLRLPGELPGRTARVYLSAGIVGFGLGSPLVYLVSCSRIYHEAVIWGLCGSLWAVYFVVRILTGSIAPRRGFLGLSVAFGVAVLGRVTFGVPIALIIAVLLLREVLAPARAGQPAVRKLAGVFGLLLALSPALVAGLAVLWYNHARFGSIWKSIDFSATYVHPETIGGVVNLARIPSALWTYLGITASSFWSQPPFLQFAPVHHLDDSIFFEWKEHALSLSLGSPWLVLGAVLGLVALVRRWRSWQTLVALAFLPEVALIVTFYFVTQRYVADFLPLLVFLFSIFLLETGRRGRPAAWFAWVLLGLAVFSAVVTIGATLQWNMSDNGDTSDEYKTRLAHLLGRVGRAPGCDGPRQPLTASEPIAQSFSFAPARFGRTWDDNLIGLDHRLYTNGIGMHAEGRIACRVPEGAVALCAVVGLPDSSASCRIGSVVFEVRDEAGRALASTGVVRSGDPAVPLEVDVRGAREISLVVRDGGDGIDCDHGTWGDPVFLLAAGTSPSPAVP